MSSGVASPTPTAFWPARVAGGGEPHADSGARGRPLVMSLVLAGDAWPPSAASGPSTLARLSVGGHPGAMKAAVTTRYGPPEVVHVMDVPRPAPEADELLVRVHATTVNRTDCGFRAAHPWFIRGFTGMTKPKRTILGNEFAGVVEAVGERRQPLRRR